MPAFKLAALAVRPALAQEQPTDENTTGHRTASPSEVIYDVMGKVARTTCWP